MGTVYTLNPQGQIIGGGPFPLTGIPAAITFAGGLAAVDAMQLIPLQAIPAQMITTTLGNQAVNIRLMAKEIDVPVHAPGTISTDHPPVYENRTVFFLDLYVLDALIIGGVLCRDRSLIVRDAYLGFTGDLAFIDLQGTEDPQVDGLGARWRLAYWPNLKL